MGTLEIFLKICFCQFLQGGALAEELTFLTLAKVEHVIADDQLKTSAAKEKEWYKITIKVVSFEAPDQ